MNEIKLILGDCLEKIEELEDNSIDLYLSSPPYNIDLGNNKYNKNGYDVYQDNIKYEDYIKWLKNIFEKLMPKMKPGSRLCINIGDKQNGRITTHSDIIQFMKELGYITFTTIIWDKSQISNRTSWGSWNSPSSPSFPTPFEYILIFCKDSLKLQHKGETDLTKQEFIDWSLALWKLQPETKQKQFNHPAMFPISIPTRLIKMLTYIGDTVLDTFAGAGTTGVACQNLNRNFIGIEISEKYYNTAKERLAQQQL